MLIGSDGGAACGSAATTSALASATRSTVPSSSRWTGPMLVMTPISGRACAHSSAIWPRPRMPISQTTISVSFRCASVSGGRSRCCVRLRSNGASVGTAERGQDVLRRRLARRARDGDDPRRAASAHCAAQGRERRERVLGDKHRGGSARERVGQEIDVPDRHEEVTLVDASRVNLNAGRVVGPRRAVEPARTEGLDLVERERDQAAAPRRLRASRATSRSSKGTVRSRNC